MFQTQKPRSYDNFVNTVNEVIIKGNESLELLRKGRGASPMITDNAKNMVAKSKDLHCMLGDMKKDVAAGKLSKPDYAKRVDVLKTLVTEGYYSDPVGDTINQILNEWNAIHNAQSKTQPVDQVQKSDDVSAIQKQLESTRIALAQMIKKDLASSKKK